LNPGKAGLEAAVKTLVDSLTPARLVVVYYSGHGIQAGPDNCMMPVDASPGSASQWSCCAISCFLLLWLSTPSGFLVVLGKPNRSSFTITFIAMVITMAYLEPSPTLQITWWA
jgi:hypothetical protein